MGECASGGSCVGRFLEGAIDVAGLETGKAEVIYAGWLGSSGDSRSKEEMLVIELPAIERAMEEAYELCRTLDDVDETEPCLGWYRETGECE